MTPTATRDVERARALLNAYKLYRAGAISRGAYLIYVRSLGVLGITS